MSRPAHDPRDPQAGRQYDMDKCLDGVHINTRTKRPYLRAVAAAVCAAADIPPVPVVFARLPGDTMGDCPPGPVVRLNTRADCSGVNILTLLHELAHAICDDYFDGAQAHGPEFCAIYRSLLDTYQILPAKCYNLLARQHKVKVQNSTYDFGTPP